MESMRGEVLHEKTLQCGVLAQLVKCNVIASLILLTPIKYNAFEQLHLTPSHFTKPPLKSAIVLHYFKMSQHASFHIFAPSCLNDFKP